MRSDANSLGRSEWVPPDVGETSRVLGSQRLAERS